jgi:hypothetical protein
MALGSMTLVMEISAQHSTTRSDEALRWRPRKLFELASCQSTTA